MRLQASCHLELSVSCPTPFILMLKPRSGAQQSITHEEYSLSPAIEAFEFIDDAGNLCQRLVAPSGGFSVYTSAQVITADSVDTAPQAPFVEIQNLPEDILKYLLPSRYCESDRFGEMATAITAHRIPGYDQVAEIEYWLQQYIQYAPSSSELPLSPTEVNNNRIGACRDLSHLGIALCRSISIPARMVVGYLYDLEPMELHAWFEAYIADRWYTFDATQYNNRGGYVSMGYGRDAADVAIYNQFGPAVFPIQQRVQLMRLEASC
jgi:transglutaminase-like putative cysteine protease